jgi:hypothetical protein
MKEGMIQHQESKTKARKLIGKVLCVIGSHQDSFYCGGGVTTYNYCVRCGSYKSSKF